MVFYVCFDLGKKCSKMRSLYIPSLCDGPTYKLLTLIRICWLSGPVVHAKVGCHQVLQLGPAPFNENFIIYLKRTTQYENFAFTGNPTVSFDGHGNCDLYLFMISAANIAPWFKQKEAGVGPFKNIAPWFYLHLPSFSARFESQHVLFNLYLMLKMELNFMLEWEKNKNKTKSGWDCQYFKKSNI